MEKAILKTLLYADLFDYPMKAWEIHKWLISKKGSLKEVDKGLKSLEKKGKVKSKKEFWFLPESSRTVNQRIKREEISKRYLREAKFVAFLLKTIPFIKLVGVSGSLSWNNAKEEDDIDLFIVTARKRVWISRILVLFILELLGKRRKRGIKSVESSGKICVNLLLDLDSLEQDRRDIYVAHEVLQMRVLWQRDGVYTKFLEDNAWALESLPNWTASERAQIVKGIRHDNKLGFLGILDDILRWLQIRYMGKVFGKERINEGALYFHPEDIREKVLGEFKERLKGV